MNRHLRIMALRLRSLWRGADLDRELDEELRDHVERQVERQRRRGHDARASASFGAPRDRRCRAAQGGNARHARGVGDRVPDQRPAAGVPPTPEAARLCRDGDPVAGARHRRQHRDLPTPERARVPAAAGARAARARRGAAHRRRTQRPAHRPQRAAVAAAVSGAAAAASRRSRRCWPSATRASISPTRAKFVTSRACGCRARSSRRSAWPRRSDASSGQPTIDRSADIPGAVISHALWQREFGGRADVLRQSIPFDGQRVPIIGVTPPSFFGVEVGRQFDVALPLCSSGFELRNHWWLARSGGSNPGGRATQAQAHVQGLLPGIQRDTVPATYRPEEIDTYVAMRADLRRRLGRRLAAA